MTEVPQRVEPCPICGCRDGKWLRVRSVSEMLEVPMRTVQSWIQDGKLQAVRVGRQYRIVHESLDDFLRREPELLMVAQRKF